MANEIQQPKPYDLVGNPIRIGGIGQGFEATLNYRVHDGHDERTGFFNVGGGGGEHGQFQLAVDVAADARHAARGGVLPERPAPVARTTTTKRTVIKVEVKKP